MKKAPTKNKKVTIDDLAVLITEGREEANDLARMVARGLERVEGRLEKVEKDITEVKKDILEVKENLGSTRLDVLAMGDRFTLKYEFYDLSTRVGLLEQRAKTKK